ERISAIFRCRGAGDDGYSLGKRRQGTDEREAGEELVPAGRYPILGFAWYPPRFVENPSAHKRTSTQPGDADRSKRSYCLQGSRTNLCRVTGALWGSGGNILVYSPLWPFCLPHLRQRGFGLGQPEGHVHSAIEVDGRGQGGAGLLSMASLVV